MAGSLMKRGFSALLWILLAGLPRPLEWAYQLRENAQDGAEPGSCAVPFVLAIQGPCDSNGPCHNPHHAHHGHRHPSPPAISCESGPNGRQHAADLQAGDRLLPDLRVQRFSPLSADPSPLPIYIAHPAGRSPPDPA
jgi:hypothetical protein